MYLLPICGPGLGLVCLALMYDLQILPAHIKETDNYLLSHARSVIDGVEVYF